MESLYFNENQIKNLNIIGKGCEGKVVKLNNNTAIKLYNASKFNLHNFKFTNFNFKYIILPKSKIYINSKFVGYSMDYLCGNNINSINLSKIPLENLIIYLRLINEEIKKLSYSLVPFDDINEKNIIYNNGFYIIDSFSKKDETLNKDECFKYNNRKFNKIIFYKLLKENSNLYQDIYNNDKLKKLFMSSTPFDNLPYFLEELNNQKTVN